MLGSQQTQAVTVQRLVLDQNVEAGPWLPTPAEQLEPRQQGVGVVGANDRVLASTTAAVSAMVTFGWPSSPVK